MASFTQHKWTNSATRNNVYAALLQQSRCELHGLMAETPLQRTLSTSKYLAHCTLPSQPRPLHHACMCMRAYTTSNSSTFLYTFKRSMRNELAYFSPMSYPWAVLHNSLPRVTLGIFSDFMLKSVGPELLASSHFDEKLVSAIAAWHVGNSACQCRLGMMLWWHYSLVPRLRDGSYRCLCKSRKIAMITS